MTAGRHLQWRCAGNAKVYWGTCLRLVFTGFWTLHGTQGESGMPIDVPTLLLVIVLVSLSMGAAMFIVAWASTTMMA